VAVRSDHDPSAAKRGLARSAGSLLVHGALFGFGFLPSRHAPRRAKDQRTLVFVHGFGANRAVFFPLQTYLRLRGFGRQLAYNHTSAGSVEALGLELKRLIDSEVKGGRIDLICHSLGGLVARFYLQQLGGSRRVDRLITLGTPHHGTYAGAWVPTTVASQLVPGGPFLSHLNGLPAPEDVRCWSLAGERDLVVLPQASSLAPFGESRTFDELGHNDLLLSPRVFKTVHGALTEV